MKRLQRSLSTPTADVTPSLTCAVSAASLENHSTAATQHPGTPLTEEQPQGKTEHCSALVSSHGHGQHHIDLHAFLQMQHSCVYMTLFKLLNLVEKTWPVNMAMLVLALTHCTKSLCLRITHGNPACLVLWLVRPASSWHLLTPTYSQ